MDATASYAAAVQAYAAGWRRPARRTVSQWADASRRLPAKGAAEAGRWRTARVPFIREIMDCLSPEHPARRIVFQKSTQVAGTEAVLNWLGATIEDSPAPMMIVQPTIEIAERFSKQRVGPMIEESPSLRARVAPARSRDSGNTTLLKEYSGGLVIMAGANSAAGLRSMPIARLGLDEVDAYPQDLEGEGDPVDLAERRTSTFPRRKILLVSTPTIKGASRIDEEYQLSDQRHYHVPCPHCGHYQPLEWSQLCYDPDASQRVTYSCRENGCEIEEHHKPAMLAAGVWIATYPERTTRGYHINALYTPIGLGETWTEHVARYLRVKDDPVKLKSWTNTTLGLAWEDLSRSLRGATLSARAEPLPLRVIPRGYLLLTCGVDVQPDRLSCSIWAWGRDERGWLVDRVVIPGNPDEPAVWQHLDALRKAPLRNAAGTDLCISMTAIDSGGANTHAVYHYVRTRRHDRLIGIKGHSHPGRPVIGRATKVDINWRGQMLRHGAEIYLLGTDTAKHTLIPRMVSDAERTDPESRRLRWPTGLPDDFFEELCAEVYDPRLRRWVVLKNRRNEALDELVYAFAAAQHPFVRINALREHEWAQLQALLEPITGDLFAPASNAGQDAPTGTLPDGHPSDRRAPGGRDTARAAPAAQPQPGTPRAAKIW